MPGAQNNILDLVRDFAAPVPYVFALWSRPEFVSAWWGPVGHRLTVCEIDFRPGGHWRFNMEEKGMPHWIRGVYHEILPGKRLSFSYHFDEFDVHSVVSVRFEPDGAGTRMHFRQTGFPSGDGRDGHERGWNSTFDILQKMLFAVHGIGSVLPDLPEARMSGVARDLAEARCRHDEEIEGRR
jgi:uncharacterized protein YndB with AHSA1/START domain